jgi:hypothetical protein
MDFAQEVALEIAGKLSMKRCLSPSPFPGWPGYDHARVSCPGARSAQEAIISPDNPGNTIHGKLWGIRPRSFKLLMAVALGFALSASLCQARLGDTKDQCIARWGQPLPTPDFPPPGYEADTFTTFSTFAKDGYHIVVGFNNGAVGVEMISKQVGGDLSDTEKAGILGADSAGLAWVKSTAISATEDWTRNDGALASYAPFTHVLTIKSKDYKAAEDAKAAADAKAKAVKDF